MTFEEKMEALERHMDNYCTYMACEDCEFFEPEDDTDGNNFCGIRDNDGDIPYYSSWNMKIALGLEKPYKPVFPEAVEESIMRHFTEVE